VASAAGAGVVVVSGGGAGATFGREHATSAAAIESARSVRMTLRYTMLSSSRRPPSRELARRLSDATPIPGCGGGHGPGLDSAYIAHPHSAMNRVAEPSVGPALSAVEG